MNKTLESQLREAREECEEQARLLGMSGSREAKLLTELVAAKAEIDGFKERDKNQVSIMKTYRNAALSLQSENKRLKKALSQITLILGPGPILECCEVAEEKMSAALEIAKAALSPEK